MNRIHTILTGSKCRAVNPLSLKSRIACTVALLAGAATLGLPAAGGLRAAEEDGVALAIVYDTSGSMMEAVPDKNGGFSPKYIIANRALISIAAQIEKTATNAASGPPPKIMAGLYIFDGTQAKAVVKFGSFDAAAIEKWASSFSKPAGGTPLGNALLIAGRAVLDSPLSRKHVLFITDGINTLGPPPTQVIPQLNQLAEAKTNAISIHFVALGVNTREFEGVKRLGATVVGASDEAELDSQLQFILQNQILLEKEEPTKH
jgi:hypothetical protein